MRTERILVALSGAAIDPDVIALAAAVGKPHKAKIVAVHVIEVRWNLPLDAVLQPELERSEEVLAAAEGVAQKLGIELETEILQAREAAAAIIDTAIERKSDLIVLGMPYRRRLGKTYVGKTVQNVYVGATCAVVAYREPQRA